MRSRGLRRRVLLCAMMGGALVSTISASTQAPMTDLAVTDRVIIASKVYAMVQQYFAHWESAPRPEVEAAYREYIDDAVRGSDRKDCDLATMRFIARLRNGHTQSAR